MEEQIGIARQITVSHPERSVSPYSQRRAASPPADDQAPSTSTSGPSGEPPAGFVRLGPDEVVIRKAVLRGIKRGAKLALKGKLPASFSAGSASAGDVPFAVPKPGKDEVHCTFCRKDFSSAKALRRHLHMHEGKLVHVCPKCGKHLASKTTMEMHQSSCDSQDYPQLCDLWEGLPFQAGLVATSEDPPASRQCCGTHLSRLQTSLQPGQDHEGAPGNAQKAFSMPSGGMSSHIQSAKASQPSPLGETWLRLKKKLVLSAGLVACKLHLVACTVDGWSLVLLADAEIRFIKLSVNCSSDLVTCTLFV